MSVDGLTIGHEPPETTLKTVESGKKVVKVTKRAKPCIMKTPKVVQTVRTHYDTVVFGQGMHADNPGKGVSASLLVSKTCHSRTHTVM